jgi:hypothetical protein
MKKPTRAFTRVGLKIGSASKLGGFPGRVIAKSFIGQRIEFPSFCVSLDLAIPCSCIKLSEPLPKLCEFLSRESGDSLLEGFHFAHTETNLLRSSRGGLRLFARVSFDYRHHF